MDDIFFDSESDQQGIPVITGPTLTGSSRDDIFTVSEGDTFVILGGDGIDTVQVLTNEIFINGIGLSSGPVFDSTQSLFGITNGVTELRFDSIERLELLVQHVFVTNRPGTNIPFTPTDADNILATLYQVGTASEDIIDLQGEDVFFFLEVHAGAGDDLIIGPDLSAFSVGLSGGNGNDTIIDGTSNATLIGGAGEDRLAGNEGNDVVDGGVGIDTAVFNGSFDSYIIIPSAHGSFIITDTIGSDGEDTLHNIEFLEFSDQQIVATELFANEQASMGDDILVGSNDLDSLFGQRGNDILTGGEGDDSLNGGLGDDTLFGDTGDDILHGNSGNDIINGGNGNDTVNGGAGDDTLNGDNGQDILNGSSGDDTINGGSDDDILNGNSGDDDISGGIGNDDVNGGGGNDTIFGGTGDDILYGSTGDDVIQGNFGDDLIHGGNQNDTLSGFRGADILNGGRGNDSLNGGDGNDTLMGETGQDVLIGGEGDDMLEGGFGGDDLFGEDGNDTLFGGEGNDNLDGGRGVDTFIFAEAIGVDRVHDFENGIDVIDFSEFILANDFSAVMSAATQVGGANVRLEFNAENVVILENVLLVDLDATDFVF